MTDTIRTEELAELAAKASAEKIATMQNTDPATDPAEALASGTDAVEGTVVSGAGISQEEYEALKAERDQLQDRCARLQAEFENARKREQRERAEFRDYATGNVVEQFLPVLDNFQLALKSGGTAEQLRVGVELIVKQMEEALRALQVQAIETVGAPFDPHVHEAIETVERPDVPDHQVIDEVRRGYRIREKLLRPALVRVASNPSQKEA